MAVGAAAAEEEKEEEEEKGEEEEEEEDAARLGGGVPVAAGEPAGAGRAVRGGAHPHVPPHALEHHPHAQPPPPQHPGERRPRHRAVRGAGGHRLQPGPPLLPLRHVRPDLHPGVPLRPHQAVPLRLPARPGRLRAHHAPLQPQLARQPGLRRPPRLRPRRLHLPRGHRHRPAGG